MTPKFIDEVVKAHGDDARWKVLGFHHSIYSTATHNSDLDVKKLREAIPPVAARNDIDLVVSGHDHIYNRTFLMDSEGKKVEDSDAGFEQEKEDGQTIYLTLTSSSGSKFYDYVPGLEWEAKSVHNDTPAFTRVRVSDEALQATTYEVPAGGAPQPEAQTTSEKIDDVEITRAEDEAPEPGADVDADANADADGADAGGGSDTGGGSNSVDAATGSDGTEADSGSDTAEASGTTESDDANEPDGTTADVEAGAEANATSAASGSGATSANVGSDADAGDLPRTGTQLGAPIIFGAAAIIIGAVLLFVSRRRCSLR
ncbi:LPXTG cell wall anchor domain-containing protein [Brevibacterium aurantiacum]|uniref:LPXTG cell wall anchor domain-containing protein n=1 Tax=Brevibacterium aurantiacum TaxID=273384 RepID=A0A2A3ZNE5_BREAU|nr:LPXTG cell wall anchor domain-containing protein [Brevibacterium aurantiacum]AZT92628.1 hypothetical protein CXR23_05270 [Brevibacterium aurantiacum]PCC53512.1 hypothetical protein CIK59_12465 [Brevibacterium aurantiacum]